MPAEPETPEVPGLRYPDTLESERRHLPIEDFVEDNTAPGGSLYRFTEEDPLNEEERMLVDEVLDAPDQVRLHGVTEELGNDALLLAGRSFDRMSELETTLDEVVALVRDGAVRLGISTDDYSVSLSRERRDNEGRNPDKEDPDAMDAFFKEFIRRFMAMKPGDIMFISANIPYSTDQLKDMLAKIGVTITSEVCNVTDTLTGRTHLAELRIIKDNEDAPRNIGESVVSYVSADGKKRITPEEAMENGDGLDSFAIRLEGSPKYYVVTKEEPAQAETVRQWLLKQPLKMCTGGVLHFADCSEAVGGRPTTYADVQGAQDRFRWGRGCNCLVRSKKVPNGVAKSA